MNNDAIITGIFTLGGAAIGVLGTFLVSRENRKAAEHKKTFERFANQIKAYWNLEKLYCEKMAKLIPDKSAKTIMDEFRSEIEEKGYERPTMTENEVNKYIK